MLSYGADDYVANTRGRGPVAVVAIIASSPIHLRRSLPPESRDLLLAEGQVFLVFDDERKARSLFSAVAAEAETLPGQMMTMVLDLPDRRTETFEVTPSRHPLPKVA